MGERVRFTGRLAPVEDADDLAATVTPARSTRARRGGRSRLAGDRGVARLGPRLRGPSAREPARAGARPGRRRRRGDAAGAGRGLPHHRAHPPDGRLGHQPDPGRRLPARRGPLGRRPRSRGSASSARPGSSASCCWPAPSPACCERPRWAPSRWSAWGAAAGTAACAVSARPWSGCCSSTPGWRPPRASRCRCWRPPASCWSRRRGGTRWPAGCRGGWPRRWRCRRRRSWPARRWSRRSPARSAWWRWWPTWWWRPSSARPPCSGLLGGVVGLVSDRAGAAGRHPRRLVRGLDRRRRRARRRPARARRSTGAPRAWSLALLVAVTGALVLVGGPSLLRHRTSGVGRVPAARRGHRGRSADSGLAAATAGCSPPATSVRATRSC